LKSKKLFAILTLVAFMMTLVPMAAFAAGTSPNAYSAAASEVKGSNTTVSVYNDNDDLARITITFKNNSGNPVTNNVLFYIKSDRDAEIGYVAHDGADIPLDGSLMASDAGQGIVADPDSNGKVVVYVGSEITGTAKISIYNQGDADGGLLIGSVNVTIQVGDGSVTLYGIDEDDPSLDDYAADSSRFDEGETHYVEAGHGVELKAVVSDGGTPIEGKEVTFQVREGDGTWANLATAVTDEDGEATYYFEQTKTGKYEYRAKISANDISGIITLYRKTADMKTIELKTADGKKVAKGEPNNIDFYVKDKFGNLLKDTTGAAVNYDPTPFTTGDFEVMVSAAPADSKFEDDSWSGGRSGLTLSNAVDADGVIRVVFTPDKEGDYTIKIRNANDRRIAATINVEAVKFGDATSLKFVLKNERGETVNSLVRDYWTDAYGVEHNDPAGTLYVYAVNAAGVELDKTSDVIFASSDVSKVDVASGASQGGQVTIKKDAIGIYTITAHYPEDNITATYDLKVVGPASAIKATPVVNGLTASVTIQYVDKNGDNTNVPNVDSESYTVVVPSGVVASNVKNIDKTGKGSFELTAQEAGKYNVTVITNSKHITTTFAVDFAKPATQPSKTVTMFIGAPGYMDGSVAKVTDVAPFIVDGRTFVAVRPVAEAFGAEIGWNEATQTVTLTTADTTVTIVIGSNAITVVKNGVTSTVTSDVAAFIKDGRTVLPFRAVGEAFGATVNYDAATQAVTYEI